MRGITLFVLVGSWLAACDDGTTTTAPGTSTADAAAPDAAPDVFSGDASTGGPLPDATADGAAPGDSAVDAPEPDAGGDVSAPDEDADGPPPDAPAPDAAVDGPTRDAATDGPSPDLDPDASPLAPDVGPDVGPDAGRDATPDISLDEGLDAAPDMGPDLGVDAAPDLGVDAAPDVAPDALAPDAGPPRSWYVAAAAEAPGTGDEDAPFPTINGALEVAAPGDTVLVGAGEYGERVVIALPGVQIGAEAGARLVGDGEDPALEMSAPDVVVTGLTIDGAGARMIVRIDDCDGCALVDCEVSNARGDDGAPGRSGSSARGVFIGGGTAVRVEGCSVADVRAGAGGDATEERRARAGALAAGINAQDTTDLLLRGNTVTGAIGGAGGAGDPPGVGGNSEQLLLAGGLRSAVVSNTVHDVDAPGRGVGICVLQSEATTSAFNHVRHIHAGGAASGLLLLFTGDHAATNELIHDIAGATAGGVRVDTGTDVRADHLTVRGVAPDDDGDAAAVLLESGDVEVRNSILSGAPSAVWSAGDNPPEAAQVSYTLTFELTGEAFVNTTDAGDNASADPAFVDPVANADLRLAPGSPAVDSADPVAPCEREPQPAEGACRADLGHTGNTPAAHAR